MERELDQISWSIPMLHVQISLAIPFHSGLLQLLNRREHDQRILRHRLGELADYEMRTRSLYSGIEAELWKVRHLLARIDMQNECAETGKVSLPTMDDVSIHMIKISWLETLMPDGVPDIDAIAQLLAQKDHSEIEFQALVKVFADVRVRDADILAIIDRGMEITGLTKWMKSPSWTQNPTDFQDLEVRTRFLTTMDRITQELTTRFIVDANAAVWNGELQGLGEQLRRVQLVSFLNDVMPQVTSGITYRCTFTGEILPVTSLTQVVDINGLTHETSPFINYRGESFLLSNVNALSNASSFKSERWLDFQNSRLSNISCPFNKTIKIMFDLTGKLFKPIGTIQSGVKMTLGVADVVNAFAQHGVRLSQADATHAIEMYMASISMIGGGIAGFERHDGTVHMLWSTLYTNTAMINLAGIASLPYEITQAEALASLVDVNHEHRTVIHRFIQPEIQSGSSQFSRKLIKIFHNNFDEIGLKYPGLELKLPTDRYIIPTQILNELIRLEKKNR